jgi:hypothetical protein
MDSAPRSSRIRPIGSLIVLAILCLLTPLALTRCKYGPDKVAGLDRGRQSPANQCIHNCSEQFEDSLKAENKLHKKNIQACGGDDDDDDDLVLDGAATNDATGGGGGRGNPACITQENARHRAAIQRIAAGLRQCIEGCHHQGGGRGR